MNNEEKDDKSYNNIDEKIDINPEEEAEENNDKSAEENIMLETEDYNIGAVVMTAEQKKEILKERAYLLSLNIDEVQSTDRDIDIVEFGLAKEKYGIQSKYISQSCILKDLIQLPGVPSFVMGITSLHEQIISVIDIRIFFGLKSPGITNLNKIIVLHSEKDNIEFGILIDEIYGMKTVAESSIQSSLATLSDNRAKYFYGLTQEHTIILDGYKILTDPEIVVE